MAAAPRCRERLFAFYFLSHIPVTLLIDLQALLPAGLHPRAVSRGRGRDRGGSRSAQGLRGEARLNGSGGGFLTKSST